MKSYGISKNSSQLTEIEIHLENLDRKGFSIKKDFLSKEQCDSYIEKIESIYKKQEADFGKENLASINELNLARMPFVEDSDLMDLILDPFILEVVRARIGNAVQLNLQNAIINKPKIEHHQSSWHRDLPYQNWKISKPLAVNAFYCMTDFNNQTGATYLLPYSHHFSEFPSDNFAENEKMQVVASKGSVVFFDSMVFHRAGSNSSNENRIGVNNMFTIPIIKPQVDISSLISQKGMKLSDSQKEIFGIRYKTPKDVTDFRNLKLGREDD